MFAECCQLDLGKLCCAYLPSEYNKIYPKSAPSIVVIVVAGYTARNAARCGLFSSNARTVRVNFHNHTSEKRITFQGNWSMISLSPDYFLVVRTVRLCQTRGLRGLCNVAYISDPKGKKYIQLNIS